MSKKEAKFLDSLGAVNAEQALEALDSSQEVKCVPTGFPSLDIDLLKIGGLPVGKLIEIYGENGNHKSLLTYRIIAQFQKFFPDKRVFIVDTENKLSDVYGLTWLRNNGVDLSRVDYVYSAVAEDTLNKLTKAASSGVYSLLVLDSLGNAEVGNFMEKPERFERDGKTNKYKTDKLGEFAKTVGNGTKSVVEAMSRTNTTMIAVNQVRSAIDMWGVDFLTPGGHVFHHNRSIAIQVSNSKQIKDAAGFVVGQVVKAYLSRSIVGPIGRTSEGNHLEIFYDQEGQVKAHIVSLINVAVSSGVITKKGTWYYWGELKFQGEQKFAKALLDDPDLRQRLDDAVTNNSVASLDDNEGLYEDTSVNSESQNDSESN